MELTERKLKILQAIIRDYVVTAEPVGSRTLSKKYEMGISPATIRNEMADLEDMGYLTHPHTSAGRVPSDKAYRLYVNKMMGDYEIPEEEKQAITSRLTQNIGEFDKTIERAAELLSEITSLTSFAITPKQESNTIKYINILPADEHTVVLMIVTDTGKIKNVALKINVPYTEEGLQLLSKTMTHHYKERTISDVLTLDIIKHFESDIEAMSRLVENIYPNFLSTLESMLDVELFMDGMTNIFNLPEYNDIEKAKLFLEMVSRKKNFTDVLVNRDDGVIITIGDENSEDIVEDSSLITATYHVNGRLVGKLGVVGPTRMRYDEITSVIEYMTKNIDDAFKLPKGGEDE